MRPLWPIVAIAALLLLAGPWGLASGAWKSSRTVIESPSAQEIRVVGIDGHPAVDAALRPRASPYVEPALEAAPATIVSPRLPSRTQVLLVIAPVSEAYHGTPVEGLEVAAARLRCWNVERCGGTAAEVEAAGTTVSTPSLPATIHQQAAVRDRNAKPDATPIPPSLVASRGNSIPEEGRESLLPGAPALKAGDLARSTDESPPAPAEKESVSAHVSEGAQKRNSLDARAKYLFVAGLVGIAAWWLSLLFTRIDPARVMKNATRARVYAEVQAHPGVRASEISRGLDLHLTTVQYHLRLLARHGLVGVMKSRSGDRYAAASMVTRLANETARPCGTAERLLHLVRERPGICVTDVARTLGVSAQLASHHARSLGREGAVVARKEGRKVLLHPPL